jgi:hypothetical protein
MNLALQDCEKAMVIRNCVYAMIDDLLHSEKSDLPKILFTYIQSKCQSAFYFLFLDYTEKNTFLMIRMGI